MEYKDNAFEVQTRERACTKLFMEKNSWKLQKKNTNHFKNIPENGML